MVVSDCCGEAPSFLSDDLCGGCNEWAEFNNEDDE